MKRPAWRRWLRAAGWLVVVLLVVLTSLAAYLLLAFDPSSLKPKLAAWVHGKYQRQLIIAGDIRLKFWPHAHLELVGVTLSEPSSTAAFASLQRGLVALRLAPLLRRQVVVDALTLEGLSLQVKRFADGRLNIDDLLRAQDGTNFQVDIAQLVLRDASLLFEDARSAQRWQASALQLTAGRIALGKPGELHAAFELADAAQGVQVKASLSGGYRVQAQPFAFALRRMDARIAGRVGDMRLEQLRLTGELEQGADGARRARELSLQAKAQRGAAAFALEATWPAIEYAAGKWQASAGRAKLAQEVAGAAQQFSLQMDALHSRGSEWVTAVKQLGWSARAAGGEITARLSAPLAYDLQSGALRSSKAQLTASWKRDADTTFQLDGNGELLAQPAQGTWNASAVVFQLRGALPAAQLEAKGSANLEAHASEARYALALDALQLSASNQAGRIEIASSKPLSAQLNGDSVAAALNALKVQGVGETLRMSGQADLSVTGSLSQNAYAFKPVALQLAGKGAGNSAVKLNLRSEASVVLAEQRARAPSARLEFESRAAGRVTRAEARAEFIADWKTSQLLLRTPYTRISIPLRSKGDANSRLTLSGVLDVNWTKPAADFAGKARLDDSNIKGRLAWDGGGASAGPSYSFDVDIDQLDWNRYAAAVANSKPPPRAAAQQRALDLEQLRALRAKGVARIGSLKAHGIVAKDVKLQVQ